MVTLVQPDISPKQHYLLPPCWVWSIADNLLQLFIFWELVGLCSYLLIGFWYRKPSAAAAAKKAFLTTRVGDVLFLAGIILLYNNLANPSLNIVLKPGEYLLQFPVIYAHISQIPADQLTLIASGTFGRCSRQVWSVPPACLAS